MMKKVKDFAAQLGLGLGTAFCLFYIPQVQDLFSMEFLVLVRQVLILGVAVCVVVSPESLISLGSRMAPKIISILSIFINNNKSKSES